MSYVINFEIEVDAEEDNVAERFFHQLFEVIIDEDYVSALKGSQPQRGTVNVDE